MPTYVLATITGREAKAKKLIESTQTSATLYIPEKVMMRRYEGTWHEERQILFPGYIFVETSNINAFRAALPIRFYNTYLRVIGNNGEEILHVTEAELEWIERLTNPDGVVPISRGIKVGGLVRFTSGPLVGMEGSVVHIDRHKRIVTLERQMFGRRQFVKVAGEIISSLE